MNFYDQVSKNLELNIVIEIDGEYYSTKQVDVGLVIPDENIIVTMPRINGTTFDIRKISTPIGTFSFKLMEYNYNETSSKIMRDESQFLTKEVKVYLGHITGSFDFSDYIEVMRANITTVTKIPNGYSIKCKELTNLINQPAYNIEDTLQTHLLSNSTTLDITDGSQFPSSGLIKVGSEFMYYTSKNANTLQNLQRAQKGTIAEEHDVGEDVFLVLEINNENPVDVLLKMMLSVDGNGANGVYDVYANGLGIAQTKVNIAQFEAIRDEFFIGEAQSFLVYGYKTVLKFFEDAVLPSLNARFITEYGKIGLSVLDQVDFEQDVPVLDESSIIGTPKWKIDSNKIVNKIEIQYDYNYANGKYESLATYTDQDSINTFGESKPLKLKFKGVTSGQNGGVIVADRANRLLQRLSTARGSVELSAHFDVSQYPTGQDVQLIHRYLPQQGGTLGFSDQLEIMSKDLDLINATVKYKLEFTSYTGIRLPFIAPSVRITTVINQRRFEVSDSSCFEVGYICRLFKDGDPDIDGNPTAGEYLLDDQNVISSIQGNIIEFENDFSTQLEIGFWLKLANYDEVNEKEKAKYAFIGSNTGYFSDGSKSYQIIY